MEIRALRTYLKSSLSLQDASIEFPRVVIGSPDGGFFMTFNGHETQKGYNEIEFLALDRNNGPSQWIAGVIKNSEGSLKLIKNVSKCTSCHGDPIRPIWAKYPSWPNAFGSVDDWLPDSKNVGKGSKFFESDRKSNTEGLPGERLTEAALSKALVESQQFRKFRQNAKSHPRYSVLEMASDNSSPVYPYTEIYRNRNNAFRPNLLIGSLMTLRQNEIMQSRIKANKFFNFYRNAIFHYSYCLDVNKSNQLNAQINLFFDSQFSKIYDKPWITIQTNYSDSFMSLVGTQLHEQTLVFANSTDYLGTEGRYFSGHFDLIDNTVAKLLESYLKTWKDKDTFVYPNGYADPYNNLEEFKKDIFFGYMDSRFFKKQMYQRFETGRTLISASRSANASESEKMAYVNLCDRLARMATKELKSNLQTEPIPANTNRSNSWPAALDSCVRCHEGKDRVASLIPFSNPKQLAEFDRYFVSSHGFTNILEAVNFMVSEQNQPAHLGGLRMPLGQQPLTDIEVNSINVWIKDGLR